MPDKLPKEDSHRIWERVLSSIPHGLKVRLVSVNSAGDERMRPLPDQMERPPEEPTPGPFGPE